MAANSGQPWVLRPFEGVGPVAFGAPRAEVRATLGHTHPHLSTYDDYRRVPEDRFVNPDESIVGVEYDDEQRVLTVSVAIRPVTLPDGLPLVGVPAQGVLDHLAAQGLAVDPDDVVADLGLRLWVAFDRTIPSVIARRRDYRDVLAAMNDDEATVDAVGVNTTVRCVVCSAPAAEVEVTPPGRYPAAWESWSAARKEIYLTHRPRGQWWHIYSGPGGSNGYGNAVSPEEGRRTAEVFREPVGYDDVAAAGLHDMAGFCRQCRQPYCPTHWHVSGSGYGRCPRGHGQSLDPHWSPDD